MVTRVKTITVSVSKKTPIPGRNFSSQSFGITSELQVIIDPDESPEETRREVNDLVDTIRQELEAKVDEWMAESADAGATTETDREPGPSDPNAPKSPPKRATQSQVEYITTLAEGVVPVNEIAEHFKRASLGELTRAQASKVIDALKKVIERANHRATDEEDDENT